MLAAPASAGAETEGFPFGSRCHAGAGPQETYASVAAEPARWTCADKDWPMSAERVFVRFDLTGTEEMPRELRTRLKLFDTMRITAIGADGSEASRKLTPEGFRPATNDWLMFAELPPVAGPPAAVILQVNGARHAGLFSDATLTSAPADTPGSLRFELILAAICGLLCVPLVFNFAFYRVLREKFLLWHAVAVVFMLIQTLVSSGLINRFADLSLKELCLISATSFSAGIVAAAYFSADLIEPGKLDPVHRLLMRLLAPWIAVFTAFYLFADGPLRPYATPAYYAAFIPVLVLFVWIMAVAARRGSRAVRFQIAAWSPIMIVGVVRVGSALGLSDVPLELQLEQHVAIALEVLITSLSVADRFMIIRKQRDLARADARVFEARATLDPLTGLLNRGVIEERFDRLRNEGFRTMAVIDLDHFKQVNDTHGHATGDAVLRAVAIALAPDEDTIAVRLGGEEFLLLLRGSDAAERAERRRIAISTRTLAEIPGLDRLVTASMGLVEQPEAGRLKGDFEVLYAHCDKLLYEAKAAGRNRTMSERLQSFAISHRRATRAAA
ncbi:hypothetical protein GCM10011371_26460 [Novosphingobium marinum]|nr:diguanylate cyclase [Novosphingobium marinum]GGC37692.1 hypothetical protein GCM10011371_26460 [Novosphingobium marinum]